MYRIAHEAYDPHASFWAQVEFDLTDRGRCYEYPLLSYIIFKNLAIFIFNFELCDHQQTCILSRKLS